MYVYDLFECHAAKLMYLRESLIFRVVVALVYLVLCVYVCIPLLNVWCTVPLMFVHKGYLLFFFLSPPLIYFYTDAAVVLLGNGLLGVRDALLEESHARRIGSQDDATPSPDITHLCLLTHKQKLFLGSSTYGAHIVSNNIEEFCDAAAGPHTLSSEVWMATTTPKQQSLINRTITVEYSGR